MLLRSMALTLVVFIAGFGCDSKDSSTPAQAVESSSEQPVEQGGDDRAEPFDHAHEDEDDHFHLGGKMYEISRRFSTIWFAGQSGNADMVKYQTHELEEVIAEIAEAKPTENDVDVTSRLKSDLEAHFEDLEEQAAAKDKKAFEATYRKVMGNCTVCHADTNHGFIQVKIPEYNPYPNLAY